MKSFSPILLSLLLFCSPVLTLLIGVENNYMLFALVGLISFISILESVHSIRKILLANIDLALIAWGFYQICRIITTADMDFENIAGSLLWIPFYISVRCMLAVDSTSYRALLLSIILSGGTQSIIVLLQLVGFFPSLHPAFSVTGSFLNPGHLGGYLSVTAVIAIALLYSQWNRINKLRRWTLIAFAVLMVTALVLSASRTACLAFLSGIITAVGIIDRRKRLALYLTGILVLLIPLLYFIFPPSADGRILIWKVILTAMPENWLTGYGAASYHAHYMEWQGNYFAQPLRPLSEIMLASDDPPPFCEILRCLSQYGLIGAGLIIAIMLMIVRDIKHMSDDQRLMLCGLCVIFVYSLASYPLDIFPIYILLIVLLGLSVPHTGQRFAFCLSPLKRGIITTLSVCVALLMTGGAFGIGRIHSILEEFYLEENESAEYKLSEWIRQSPSNVYCVDALADILISKSMHTEAIPCLHRAITLHPTGHKYIHLGDCYLESGNQRQALQYYKRAAHMLPAYATPVLHSLWAYQDLEEWEQADSCAFQILSMPVKVENGSIQYMRKTAERYLRERNHSL